MINKFDGLTKILQYYLYMCINVRNRPAADFKRNMKASWNGHAHPQAKADPCCDKPGR